MPPTVKIDFLTSGCNNETGIFDESDGFLIYAGGRNVFVSQIPDETGSRPVTCALPHAPKGRVHYCQWIKLANSLGTLVASDDGFLRYYHCENTNASSPLQYTAWSVKMEIDLGSAVTLASFVPLTPETAVLAAATVKGEIYFINWDGSKNFIRSYSPKKITALSIGILPNTQIPFILAALSDSTIRVIIGNDEVLTVSGHQNWITSLSVKSDKSGNFVNVLSSSLDKTIRVWKIQESSCDSVISSGLMELVPQKNSFKASDKEFTLIADSLALGHENAVFFARFVSPSNEEDSLQILSGSSDRSLILWSRGFGGAWKTALQLGDLNGSLGTIGTDHTFAFYGGTFYKNEWIAAAASTGSILFWKRSTTAADWIPQIPITGHVDRVESIAWAPSEASPVNFLTLTSKDQTTRIFAPFDFTGNYREIARPQIHGYDLKCVTLAAFQRQNTRVFELISGADEKVLRVFHAPKQFYRKLGIEIDELVPESAELPALGLSNKTQTQTQTASVEGQASTDQVSNVAPAPENEGDLVRNSLWPEIDKLYGHNQEISALALSPSRKFMASSAKSHLVADAALRLWSRGDTFDSKWLPLQVVQAHNLTVSCLVFSPDSQKLLSVSRDRNFCLISPENGIVLCRQEAHSRMIFAADWVNNESFVTGSRDKTVKYWKIENTETPSPILVQTINFENGITSLAILKNSILAVGDELGNIFLYKLSSAETWTTLEISIPGGGGLGPADSITDLKWNNNVDAMELAVASADNSIRILSFYL